MPILLIAIVLLLGFDSSAENASTEFMTAPSSETAREQGSLGDEVLARALAAHLARMEGIENYTVVQTVMGIETTTYFEREVVDGQPRFRPRMVTAAGQRVDQAPDAGEDVYVALAAYSERTTLRGTETIDGHRAYALVVEDFSGLPGMGASEVGDVEFSRATLYLDAGTYVLRRMEMEGTVSEGGQTRAVTVTGRFEDYREVRGMLHPFRTVMTVQGIGTTISETELAEARRGLEELKAQMQSMPAAQRNMMESMLRPRIEQFEAMLGGEGVDMVIDVKDLRVNDGPPA